MNVGSVFAEELQRLQSLGAALYLVKHHESVAGGYVHLADGRQCHDYVFGFAAFLKQLHNIWTTVKTEKSELLELLPSEFTQQISLPYLSCTIEYKRLA